MTDKKFNLLREPWIKVIRHDGETAEVSLLDIFDQAPGILRLANELPTLDFAILRLLLAILHATFGKRKGGYVELPQAPGQPKDARALLQRWQILWDKKAFPMEILESYLLEYEDRFWLFHPDRPFFQDPTLDDATQYDAAKLNAMISESANKTRLFALRSGEAKKTLSFAEAARWLLHLHGYDDKSSKKKPKGAPPISFGWLAELGLVAPIGNNLFETMMLNFALFQGEGDVLWGIEKPTWESDRPEAKERQPLPAPSNQSELLTLQSRLVLLIRSQDNVTDYLLRGGEFYPSPAEIWAEQMTTRSTNKKGEIYVKKHRRERLLWRDLSALLAAADGQNLRPGIVNWLARLTAYHLLDDRVLTFSVASIDFDNKGNSTTEIFGDQISFSSRLLETRKQDWLPSILEQVSWTDRLVELLGELVRKIVTAAGASKSEASDRKKSAKEQGYFQLDIPFREWLLSVDPDGDEEIEAALLRWQEEAKRIIFNLGEEVFEQAGQQAFVGRTVDKKIFSSPRAFNIFAASIASNKF